MSVHVVVGAQWGDEGKGRVVDWFAGQSDIVARYAGGDNAGHTVQVGGESFKLHLVPSGIVHPGVVCVLGGGMVVNPLKLVEELDGLEERGVDVDPARVLLAQNAHLITPAHRALDRAKEASRGRDAIGTTSRGIGPAYTDKAARSGLRAGEMCHPERFAERVKAHVEAHNRVLSEIYGAEPLDPTQVAWELAQAAALLAPYVADTALYLHEQLEAGASVLGEGAQGTLLDLDHGGYPYVTSSSATVGGAITGLGIGPKHVERVTGVAKAFTTRVGAGPFPTELTDEVGDRLRGTGENPWDEFGTTTGRPRRCGWLDMVLVRYAARINGLTDLVITKLDILSGFEAIPIANAYTYEGETLTELPTEHQVFSRCQPVYESVDGWEEDIMGIRELDDLPPAARAYVARIEELAGVPVAQVTVGPEREQAIERAYA
ncbi:MAG: adenylosuccinate synthase [Chloroflexota bacterium]